MLLKLHESLLQRISCHIGEGDTDRSAHAVRSSDSCKAAVPPCACCCCIRCKYVTRRLKHAVNPQSIRQHMSWSWDNMPWDAAVATVSEVRLAWAAHWLTCSSEACDCKQAENDCCLCCTHCSCLCLFEAYKYRRFTTDAFKCTGRSDRTNNTANMHLRQRNRCLVCSCDLAARALVPSCL